MTPTLIVLALVALGVGIVVWAVRKKPAATTTGPKESDTAWNDPVSPGEPAQPIEHRSEQAPRPVTPEEPRP